MSSNWYANNCMVKVRVDTFNKYKDSITQRKGFERVGTIQGSDDKNYNLM